MSVPRPLRTALAAICGAALTVGGVAAWDSPVLDLRQVEVSGNRRVAARDVVVASRLSTEDHLLRISTSGVAARVERNPWVARADVERILPSRVRITVVERTPAAVVSAGAASYLVDGEGVVLEQLSGGASQPSGAAAKGLPVVADLPLAALTPGERVRPPQYRQVLEVLRSLPAPLRERVTVLRAPSVEGIAIELAGGPVILFGGARGLGDKRFAVEALMGRADAEGVRLASIDVRIPTRPAVRLEAGSPYS